VTDAGERHEARVARTCRSSRRTFLATVGSLAVGVLAACRTPGPAAASGPEPRSSATLGAMPGSSSAAGPLAPAREAAAARQVGHARTGDTALAGTKRQLLFNVVYGPFGGSLRLRQAVLHAIDRTALATTLGGGRGIPLPYVLAPGTLGYDTVVPAYAYDPDRAKRLLLASGVNLPLDVRLTILDGEIDRHQGQALQSMLERVGAAPARGRRAGRADAASGVGGGADAVARVGADGRALVRDRPRPGADRASESPGGTGRAP
jgi:hypothetical protein